MSGSGSHFKIWIENQILVITTFKMEETMIVICYFLYFYKIKKILQNIYINEITDCKHSIY